MSQPSDGTKDLSQATTPAPLTNIEDLLEALGNSMRADFQPTMSSGPYLTMAQATQSLIQLIEDERTKAEIKALEWSYDVWIDAPSEGHAIDAHVDRFKKLEAKLKNRSDK